MGLGSVAWAKLGDILLVEGMYKLFLPAQVVVSQMGEIREQCPSRKYRELCCLREQEKPENLG